MVFVCQTLDLYPWDLNMVGGLCLSDRIAVLLGLEHVGWSLLVSPHSITPGT